MLFGNKPVKIEFIVGDITIQHVDAIVNAANSYLKHGGGVAGAIVRRGGNQIQQESDEYIRKYGYVESGEVAVTGAGNLNAKYIIHTVGPIGDKEENDEIMRKSLINVLKKADELGIKSFALPLVGTGIFGYPLERFVNIAVEVFKSYFKNYSGTLDMVIFCDISDEKIKKLEEAFKKI